MTIKKIILDFYPKTAYNILSNLEETSVTKIQVPTNCPSCQSVLAWRNHLLYCLNKLCSAQTDKKVEHFAKTLKIKGLGPSAIAKIGFSDISDLYSLEKDEIIDALGSEKLGTKLYEEITNSRNASLEMLLPAFSIPLIGKTASQKLSTTGKSLSEITEKDCLDVGLGPKATESLISWLETEFPLYQDLPFVYKFGKGQVTVSSKGTICISGKLKSFKTKAEAEKVLNELGYTVKSSVTKDVTILVNESGIESAKTIKARESGVTIVENLLAFIGE